MDIGNQTHKIQVMQPYSLPFGALAQPSMSGMLPGAARMPAELRERIGAAGAQPANTVPPEMLLNIALQVLASTEQRGGAIGWLQRNSRHLNNAIQAVDFARQVVPLATSGAQESASQKVGLGSSTFGKILNYGQQAYGAYKILSSDAPNDVKAQALTKQAGLMVADFYTAGLASTAYNFLSRFEIFRKIESKLSKYDPVMHSVGSLGKILGGDGDAQDYLNLATGGVAGVLGKVFGFSFRHKSTKEYQAERANTAFKMASTDADRAFVAHMYEQKQQADPDNIIRDPSNPYFGREWKWEEQKPLLRAEDVWGFLGFQEAFPDFISGFSEDERRMLAQIALDEDLLTSNKGDVIFSNSHRTPEGLTHLERIRQIGQLIKERRAYG